MKTYKIPAGTPMIVFYQLWHGETTRVLSVRNTVFTSDDEVNFDENHPDDMFYFKLPKNDRKIKAIGAHAECISIENI